MLEQLRFDGKKETEFFDPRSVAVVTTTLYRDWYEGELQDITHTDKIRGDLALESFRAAQERGYQIVVADGDSSLEFKSKLEILGIEPLTRERPGRAFGRRKTINQAAQLPEVKVIVRTEPEKVSLIADCISQVALPIVRGDAYIVIPKRDPTFFAQTYPEYMYTSEMEGNRLINLILRRSGLRLQTDEDLDIFFGPTVHKNDPSMNKLFMETFEFGDPKDFGGRKYANPEECSDAQFFPVVAALFLGKKIKSVEVPFMYPQTQRDNEDRPELLAINLQKRKAQRMGFVTEVIHYIRHLSLNEKVHAKGKLRPLIA